MAPIFDPPGQPTTAFGRDSDPAKHALNARNPPGLARATGATWQEGQGACAHGTSSTSSR
jgi:hypothetical protein